MRRPRRAAPAATAVLVAALACAFQGDAAAHPTGDLRRADLDARIAAEPRRADLRLQSGRLYAEAHDWRRARADLARSLRLDPALVEAGFELARVELESGRLGAATKALDRYLAARPADAGGLALRGALASRLGDARAAAADYDRAIAASRAMGAPAPPEWYLIRARLLVEAAPDASKRTDARPRTDAGAAEALAAIEAGLADLGGPIVLEWEALRLERILGRFDAALARADRKLASPGQPAPWLAVRAEILEEAGRTDEARSAYAAALAAYEALPAPRRSPPAVEQRILALRSALERLEDGTGGR